MKSNTILTLFIALTIIGGSSYFLTQDENIATTNISEEKPTKSGFTIIKKAQAKTINVFQANVFDYSNVKNTTEKKQVFFDTLRPIIISQNNQIKELRQAVLLAQKNNKNQDWLQPLAKKYNVSWSKENPNWKQ